MLCRDFKVLPRKTVSDKVLCDKAFKTASDPQRGLAIMVYKFFDKKNRNTDTYLRAGITCENEQLANGLYEVITRKSK